MLSLLIQPLVNKLVAYDFVNSSGLNQTAEQTGHLNSSVFSHDLFTGIGAIVYALTSLLGIIFLGLMIYGGIMWMTAEGDEQKVEKAKQIIVTNLTGLIIVMAAFAISYFVINAVIGKTLSG
ncbi:MAG TPA: hypothetical protein VMD74_01940 [Candidatus Methylomirabilis sp.]|nr:hypothetical protein [Candidatus Methylomirabilis sp.]